jgi:sugar phosphate isomerase/epimerase
MGSAAAVALASARTALGARQADPAKLARIAIMVLNFESTLKVPGLWEGPTDTLDFFDVPKMFADRYGVHNIEIQHTHFASTEDSFLKEVRAQVEQVGSRISNINLEFGPLNISSATLVARLQAIDLTKQWVDHAAVLGCPRVMINQGALKAENKIDAVRALKTMVEYGKTKNVKIGVETRGVGGNNRGVVGTVLPPPAPGTTPAPPPAPPPPGTPLPLMTTPPSWVLLAEVLRESGALANVDLGGVGAADQGELHAALRTLLPMTIGSMHIRPSPRWDLATAIKFIVALGYQGLYSIEVRGHEGTLATRDTLLANI